MLLILEAASRKYMRDERSVKRNELESEGSLFNRQFCLNSINSYIREHQLKGVLKELGNLYIGLF